MTRTTSRPRNVAIALLVLGFAVAMTIGLRGWWSDPADGTVAERRYMAATTETVEAGAFAIALKDFKPRIERLNALSGRVFSIVVETARPDAEMIAIIGRVDGVKSAEVDATVTRQGPTR